MPHLAFIVLMALSLSSQASEVLIVGDNSLTCAQDPDCFNRLHPNVSMTATVKPNTSILFRTRNTADWDLAERANGAKQPLSVGLVHPLTGPVFIEGAKAGDVLAVSILDIAPGQWGFTLMGGIAFASDLTNDNFEALWSLTRENAQSDDLPGVVIPNGSFPGIVTTLPGPELVQAALAREHALVEAGGMAFLPDPSGALPENVCGTEQRHATECLRTIPPREHGGNMDIRHLGVGSTVYLPCYLDGCGLALGDLHYAQGDGEVSGTAIEMDAKVLVTTKIIKGAGRGFVSPSYSGPSRLLDIPSRRFFATTGYPLKTSGDTPKEYAYLASETLAGLENPSGMITLAARNALDQMLNHIVNQYGYTKAQAHVIASVAVDLRIAQLVDQPNVGVTAILPVDIFVPGETPK